jgi:cbb3-type cytochrome oxidase subunit 3
MIAFKNRFLLLYFRRLSLAKSWVYYQPEKKNKLKNINNIIYKEAQREKKNFV